MSKKGQSLHELLQPLAQKYFISGEINTKLTSMDLVWRRRRCVTTSEGACWRQMASEWPQVLRLQELGADRADPTLPGRRFHACGDPCPCRRWQSATPFMDALD